MHINPYGHGSHLVLIMHENTHFCWSSINPSLRNLRTWPNVPGAVNTDKLLVRLVLSDSTNLALVA